MIHQRCSIVSSFILLSSTCFLLQNVQLFQTVNAKKEGNVKVKEAPKEEENKKATANQRNAWMEDTENWDFIRIIGGSGTTDGWLEDQNGNDDGFICNACDDEPDSGTLDRGCYPHLFTIFGTTYHELDVGFENEICIAKNGLYDFKGEYISCDCAIPTSYQYVLHGPNGLHWERIENSATSSSLFLDTKRIRGRNLPLGQYSMSIEFFCGQNLTGNSLNGDDVSFTITDYCGGPVSPILFQEVLNSNETNTILQFDKKFGTEFCIDMGSRYTFQALVPFDVFNLPNNVGLDLYYEDPDMNNTYVLMKSVVENFHPYYLYHDDPFTTWIGGTKKLVPGNYSILIQIDNDIPDSFQDYKNFTITGYCSDETQ